MTTKNSKKRLRIIHPTYHIQSSEKILVLFHTIGEYDDDWEPMTPFIGDTPNNTTNIKWNGQNYHMFDYLLTPEQPYNTIILERNKKNKPYTFHGIVIGGITLLGEDEELGTPNKYILKNVQSDSETTSYNNIKAGQILERINGLPPQDSAFHHLGLRRIEGGYRTGIQLCSKV
tara:strand:- start:94 stop:615 length:522 start_codon:yes stop_codon:yes gene_type:complete